MNRFTCWHIHNMCHVTHLRLWPARTKWFPSATLAGRRALKMPSNKPGWIGCVSSWLVLVGGWIRFKNGVRNLAARDLHLQYVWREFIYTKCDLYIYMCICMCIYIYHDHVSGVHVYIVYIYISWSCQWSACIHSMYIYIYISWSCQWSACIHSIYIYHDHVSGVHVYIECIYIYTYVPRGSSIWILWSIHDMPGDHTFRF